MEYAGHVHDALIYHYGKVRDQPRLSEDPKRHPSFAFDELDVVGDVVAFQEHMLKLRKLFSAVEQYKGMAHRETEGFQHVIDLFEEQRVKISAKPYNFLDHRNKALDHEMARFMKEIGKLDALLVQFVNSHFEVTPRTSRGLQLIRYFRRTLPREAVHEDLEQKMMVVFHNYGLDLDSVQRVYEKFKFQPPLIRNTPEVDR